ncbi:helix-turn-helix transcriptional regulator [Hephaestia sp. GCM10023244]|uniref:S24 family peptidase n=1 Tax=unclassified Hephaestia TaxID=2631281 RepID=UPI002076E7D1|nr:S24 family peptidase [Hephaestia sp. MAHUQ-44]MCM8729486.1 S24 family peptidase [Hephaestia sp. MAHUQ-44]
MESDDPRAALARLIALHGESYAALSQRLGRNPAYLQQYVTRGSPRALAERDRATLAAWFRVDEAVLGGPARAPLAVMVPRLDVAASAGPGGIVDGERALAGTVFDPALIRALGVDPGGLSLIRAQGESMMPTIADGDEIMVDTHDRRVTSRGRIFVIRLDGVLLVKRVARAGLGLAIRSDNPAYPPIEDETARRAELVGRVVWLGRALE